MKNKTPIEGHEDMTKDTLKNKKEIILGWMNAYIPDGKTIPVFEDMLDEFEGSVREDTIKMMQHQASINLKTVEAVVEWGDLYLQSIVKENEK